MFVVSFWFNTINIVSIFYYFLRLQSSDKYEKKRANTIARMNENSREQYNFEKVYWSWRLRSNSIVSKKRTIQFRITKNHIVSLRKNVLCNHITYSILQSKNSINKKTKTRSKKTNSVENIWSFRILIDLIFWQILVRSKKFEFAFFASMHTFLIDFSIIFCLLHIFDIFYEFLTVKSHRYPIIDVAKNIWKFWNSQWCYMMWFAFSFVIAELKHKIFVSWCIFQSISDIKFHIDATSHEKTNSESRTFSLDRTFYKSTLRHIWVNKSSNFDSFVFAVFASMYDLALQNLRHRKSLFGSFKQCIVEKITSLREFQDTHRWKSLHENSKSNWIR